MSAVVEFVEGIGPDHTGPEFGGKIENLGTFVGPYTGR